MYELRSERCSCRNSPSTIIPRNEPDERVLGRAVNILVCSSVGILRRHGSTPPTINEINDIPMFEC